MGKKEKKELNFKEKKILIRSISINPVVGSVAADCWASWMSLNDEMKLD